jgi:DNA recombination-dependent growth factor C
MPSIVASCADLSSFGVSVPLIAIPQRSVKSDQFGYGSPLNSANKVLIHKFVSDLVIAMVEESKSLVLPTTRKNVGDQVFQ